MSIHSVRLILCLLLCFHFKPNVSFLTKAYIREEKDRVSNEAKVMGEPCDQIYGLPKMILRIFFKKTTYTRSLRSQVKANQWSGIPKPDNKPFLRKGADLPVSRDHLAMTESYIVIWNLTEGCKIHFWWTVKSCSSSSLMLLGESSSFLLFGEYYLCIMGKQDTVCTHGEENLKGHNSKLTSDPKQSYIHLKPLKS